MKIGLTKTGSDEKHSYYVNWLRGNSQHEVITLSSEHSARVEDCDALVLSGGVDIHPRFYGSTVLDYPNADEFDEKRDEFELKALKHTLDVGKPVLGICRGLQLINVGLGGTLVQDLGAHNDIHRGGPDKRHEVHVEEETTLSDWLGVKEGDVNSAHHQAIQLLGKDLRINCYSMDGMIEGVESAVPGKLIMAVQWHPERMFKMGLGGTPFAMRLRDRFVGLVAGSR